MTETAPRIAVVEAHGVILCSRLRAWIVPRQVHALAEDFDGESIPSGEVRKRVEQLAAVTCDMARRMRLPLPD